MTQAEVIHGDCIEKMREKPENSQAAGVTDPPYGIRFMGKSWDGKDIEAKHAQRLANPSQDHRRKAGTDSGYRAASIEAGKYDRSSQASQASQAFQQFSREWAEEMFRVLMPGAYLVSFASTRTYHRMVCGIEDAGFEIRDQLAWVFGSGFPKSLNLEGDWEGWGTALKPGWEPIVLARKPFVGTIAANVAKYGTAALNIKGCRIGSAEITTQGGSNGGTVAEFGFRPEFQGETRVGRWPANLMHDGSAEVLAQFPADAGAAAPVKGDEPSAVTGDIFGERERVAGPFHGDSGSAARFFYEAKASRAEREAGCEHLPERTAAENVNRKEDSAGMDSPRAGAGRTSGRRCHHPTVKPVDLMRWLCRLVTPPGGRIIDPFLGSGTTGVAAVLENFNFTGIEREADYIPIARARIAEAQGPLFRTV